ncbi:MAG: HDIG domain-containing protein, partial [Candidatus Omnitrophica bacterium]|nr:HDIG domain-containing protein [Candidatus Omnitrophota bacterium]
MRFLKKKKKNEALTLKKQFKPGSASPAPVAQLLVLTALILLSFVVFLPGSGLVQRNISVGHVSMDDVYAPFDFSFAADEHDRVEIKKNELIIQRGERITVRQQQILTALQASQMRPQRLRSVFGFVLLFVIGAIIAVAYLNTFLPKLSLSTKLVVLVSVVFLGMIYGARGIIWTGWPAFIIPLPSLAMLVTILVNPVLAMLASMIGCLLVAMMSLTARFDVFVAMLAGCIVAIYGVKNVRHRRTLTRAGIFSGMAQMLAIAALRLSDYAPLGGVVQTAAWGMFNGILSTIIVTGVLPMLEVLFGITTNIRLLELSDLNQPALKEMVMATPGTYHHSLIVGNLAEAAAEAVGANSLLARVGAYYHDIAKMRMADYYTDNHQLKEHNHDPL